MTFGNIPDSDYRRASGIDCLSDECRQGLSAGLSFLRWCTKTYFHEIYVLWCSENYEGMFPKIRLHNQGSQKEKLGLGADCSTQAPPFVKGLYMTV